MKKHLLLKTVRGEAVPRPPVWLMRQAGRILPQYRALRNRLSGFKELVETPDLAAEVTIQPVDELGVDAAILFSDILVIPEAMGLSYEMVEKKGPRFPQTIQDKQGIQGLRSGEAAAAELPYVYEAIKHIKKALHGRVPLIGFSGAPWTLFAYMVEGQGSKTFSQAKRFLYQYPGLSHQLMEKITDSIIVYLRYQARAGVDLLQIFDSWAGILSPDQYREFSLPYLRRICDEIQEKPMTVFAKGAWFALEEIGRLDCQVIGLDWTMAPQMSRRRIGEDKVLQGNLDPCLLYADPEYIREQTLHMLHLFNGEHIANLGHGVYPDTPLEHVRTFVDTVKSFRY